MKAKNPKGAGRKPLPPEKRKRQTSISIDPVLIEKYGISELKVKIYEFLKGL